ncbi:hypothetical protein Tco_0878356 [Tanacetum coccineum]|uniref:Reverse transcriptase domain-containing protein n=1 Tax=Tanacetum coccineum TaxID=301880 RepID=A0ABQ5BXN9_9ASTR
MGWNLWMGNSILEVEENMISNEYAVKLCLEHEVKRGNKTVKKELIIVLRGEIYFVKFIINLDEDDVEPGVIFGRSFLRMTKEIADFGAGSITIYPDIDLFLGDIEEEEKSLDDWDQLLDFNTDDIPLLAGGLLTQKREQKEALSNQNKAKFALLEKVKLDGKIVKEEEEAVKRIKGEALKEKDDPGAFIFPIRLEGLWEHTMMRPDHQDTNALDNLKPWKKYCFHKFTMSFCYGKVATEKQSRDWDYIMLMSLKKMDLTYIFKEACVEPSFEGDSQDDHLWLLYQWKVPGYNRFKKKDLWLLSQFDARPKMGMRSRLVDCKVGWEEKKQLVVEGVAEDVIRSLSAPIYCRNLDTTTLRDFIDSKGRLIPEDPQLGVPGVGIPRPPRASMQDLYDRMGRMEIRQEAIERMEYRQSYHRTRKERKEKRRRETKWSEQKIQVRCESRSEVVKSSGVKNTKGEEVVVVVIVVVEVVKSSEEVVKVV